MINFIKKILHRFDWYYSLKYPAFFKWYDHLFKKELALQHKKELGFYKSFLFPCELIFDIGAHKGHKTAVFSNLAKKVISCEPDEHNYMILQKRFRGKKNIILEKLAISDRNGETDLYIHHPGSAFNTINPEWISILEKDKLQRWNELVQFSSQKQKVNTTTLDSLIIKYGRPEFVKIDVEGAELGVLKGLSQKISCLSFEVLLPEFRERSFECIELVVEKDDKTVFNYAVEEKLQLEHFMPYKEFMKIFRTLSIPHFEIIAKMPASSSY